MKKENVVVTNNTPSPALRASSPSRGEGNNSCSLPPWRGKVGEARMRGTTHGFTLIELLVVVLIIGILAAVALPQYQKAVEKSRATQAWVLLKSTHKAAKEYFLANGEYPTNFNDLAIDIPFNGHERWKNSAEDSRSNDDWALDLMRDPDAIGITIGRKSGKYKGGGFAIWSYFYSPKVQPDQMVCIESKRNGHPNFGQEKGDYCTKLFQGTEIPMDNSFDTFKLP